MGAPLYYKGATLQGGADIHSPCRGGAGASSFQLLTPMILDGPGSAWLPSQLHHRRLTRPAASDERAEAQTRKELCAITP